MLVLLILPACGQEPTGPVETGQIEAPPSPAPGSQAEGWEALEPLGTADIPIPPDNDWSRTGWNVWKPTGIQVAPGWVYVRVQGGVDYTWNPECASVPADLAQCGGIPGEGGTSGPWGSLGRVRIGFASIGSTAIVPEAPGAAFAPFGDPMTYGVLFKTPVARTIHLQRQMELGGGGTATASIGVPRYLLSGSQTVTVEQVPTPIRVVTPAQVGEGEVVVASLETRPPFRVRMPPGFSHHSVSWGFTLVDAQGRPGYRYTLWGCSGSHTCSFRPTAAGFFNAVTYVETVKVRVDGDVVRPVDSTLELTCTAPAGEVLARQDGPVPELGLARAEELACTAGVQPAGTELLVTGWSFTGTDGISRSVHPDSLSGVWAGPMVTSGRVSVAADVDGTEQMASVDVTVAPRDWSGQRVEVLARQVSAGYDRAFPARPRGDFHLSSTVFRARAPGAVTLIERGPNSGLAFLDTIALEIEALVLINEPALREGSEFHKLQDPDRPGSKVERAHCSMSVVPGLPPRLLAHEGIPADAASHIGAYQREMDSRLGGAIALLEAAVGDDASGLASRYASTLAEVHRSASDAAGHVDDTAAGRFTPGGSDGSPCALRYHFAYN